MVSRAEHSRNRYHSDPLFRQRRLDANKKYRDAHRDMDCAHRRLYQRNRYHTDPEYRERHRILKRDRYRAAHPGYTPRRSRPVCVIIAEHHLALKDDPERLSTVFLKKLIGVDCDE